MSNSRSRSVRAWHKVREGKGDLNIKMQRQAMVSG